MNDEIVLDVGNGCSVVAIITRQSTQALELKPDGKATALFKASSVIVGVPG
ncbi:Molybdenum-pterin-binding protein MopA [compost metagenome]